MGSIKSIMNESQEFIFDTIYRQPYKLHKNDCSNKAYQLYYWWRCLDGSQAPYKIYICRLFGVQHAQVEHTGIGLYDPTYGGKIECKPYKACKPASKARKLPSRCKDFERYMDPIVIENSDNFSMSKENYLDMVDKLTIKGITLKYTYKANILDYERF